MHKEATKWKLKLEKIKLEELGKELEKANIQWISLILSLIKLVKACTESSESTLLSTVKAETVSVNNNLEVLSKHNRFSTAKDSVI